MLNKYIKSPNIIVSQNTEFLKIEARGFNYCHNKRTVNFYTVPTAYTIERASIFSP